MKKILLATSLIALAMAILPPHASAVNTQTGIHSILTDGGGPAPDPPFHAAALADGGGPAPDPPFHTAAMADGGGPAPDPPFHAAAFADGGGPAPDPPFHLVS